MFLFHYFDVDLVVDAGRDTRRLFLFHTANLIPICISRKYFVTYIEKRQRRLVKCSPTLVIEIHKRLNTCVIRLPFLLLPCQLRETAERKNTLAKIRNKPGNAGQREPQPFFFC